MFLHVSNGITLCFYGFDIRCLLSRRCKISVYNVCAQAYGVFWELYYMLNIQIINKYRSFIDTFLGVDIILSTSDLEELNPIKQGE